MPIAISAAFDGGNIEVRDASDPSDVRLAIRPDAGGDHLQWFHFRVSGARGVPLVLHIENAGRVSYPTGFEGYRACVSEDLVGWGRAETRFDGERLTIRHTPQSDAVFFAYFAPYPEQRHLERVAGWQRHPEVTLERLGPTVDGRDLDLLIVGDPARDAPRVWVQARQHPGETMAEWLVEGLLDRLLDDADPVARGLRAAASWFVIPNLNPDGSARGHLRNNAAGANLNRAWSAPDPERSPEVLAVRDRMEATGVDLFLDVHGDEALPYNFIAGAEGTEGWGEAQAARQQRFLDALAAVSPDFQTAHGYPKSRPGQANLAMATNWVGQRFGCLAMTLEQPFKDTADTPRPEGWSPPRAAALGRAVLTAIWLTRRDWSEGSAGPRGGGETFSPTAK